MDSHSTTQIAIPSANSPTQEDAILPAKQDPQAELENQEVASTEDIDQENVDNVIKRISTDDKKSTSEQAAPYESPAKLLNGRFILGQNGEYRRLGVPDRVALVDEDQQVRFIDKQVDTFQAGIELAKAKNWQAIEVTGTDKFRQEAWFHARVAGLEVLGYEPHAKDIERLTTTQQQQASKDRNTEKNITESRKQAETFALSNGSGLQTANYTIGKYTGEIIHETDHHFVQDIGRGVKVIHEKDHFSTIHLEAALNAKDKTKIQYHSGKGALHTAKCHDHGHSL